MTIRERNEQFEKEYLSSYAALSMNTRGRERLEPKCDERTEYQRDRDRVLYSSAFRRLREKTQVFIAPEDDHCRTRLTHTLEVSQVARSLAKSLKLNEDLTEAIALGHDLGHTPFGHTGEAALREICPHGFEHNEQGVRVVEVLERGTGRNLTWEVRDGILNHCGERQASTLEGRLVKYADRIAYINHDIDDAISAGILAFNDLPQDCIEVFGHTRTSWFGVMKSSIVESSMDKNEISMLPEVETAFMKLKKFLFDKVYLGPAVKKERTKATRLINILYDHFKMHTEQLPEDMQKFLKAYDVDRVVCDYIASMTDMEAVRVFNDIFVPFSVSHEKPAFPDYV